MGRYQSESRYYLHVQLTGIEPPIWRTMVVPGAISLHTLHKMLQVVMGWENAHGYLFRLSINEKTIVYGLPDPEWESAACASEIADEPGSMPRSGPSGCS